MKHIIALFLALLCSFCMLNKLQAQDDVDSANLRAAQTTLIAEVATDAPSRVKYQNLKSLLMPPRDFRERGMSAYYAACSALEYYINLNSNYKVNLSPDFVYLNLLKNNASTTEILHFLQERGTVSAAVMPYGSQKVPNTIFATDFYKPYRYLHIFRAEDNARSKVYEARLALLRGNPVILKMNIRRNFIELKEYDTFWKPEAGNKEDAGVHTLLVVGYNDADKTFELMNSWGFRWGNRGCIYISYEDFGKMALVGLVIVPNEK